MESYKGKVAVITGAASGIGRALADRCVKEGMKVVLADVEEVALQNAERELRAKGADVLAVLTDVSKESDVQALARHTVDAYGAVHLLFNNAGVGSGALLWTSTVADWQWVMSVNLWGPIHAIRAFVPIMLEQQTECHIVNTASRAGLETGPGLGIYRMTKHALVSMSETLSHELKMVQSSIGVSVLCPGFVRTQICDAHRNRPTELSGPNDREMPTPMDIQLDQMMRKAVSNGMTPEEVADITFAAIQNRQFYILPDPEAKQAVQVRLEDILNDRNPSFLIPASFN